MRIFGLFILSIILCLSLGVASCSDEQEFEQSKVDIASKVNTRSVSYIPEWWDGKSQLEAPYAYQTSYWDHPYSPDAVDTCDYYFSFVYSWGTSYASQYYNRIHMQYRFAPDRYESYDDIEKVPDSEWHNIGEEYPKERYPGGTMHAGIKHELNIDAHHFPRAKLNVRYRLLHNDYPGIWPSDTIYNKILITKWTTVLIGHNAVNNTYGFTSPDTIYFHVNFPVDGRGYTYSIYVDNEQVVNRNNGLYFCEKTKKTGKYEVSAMMHELIESTSIYLSGKKEGTYNENTRDIYVNFTENDFRY